VHEHAYQSHSANFLLGAHWSLWGPSGVEDTRIPSRWYLGWILGATVSFQMELFIMAYVAMSRTNLLVASRVEELSIAFACH